MSSKPVILLMAYGSPRSLDEVGNYLEEVRGGRKPTVEEVNRLRERYRLVGGQTPLVEITNSQAQRLEVRLRHEGLVEHVYVGMKHWHPFIRETVQNIVRNGAGSIVGIALAPHYSRLSIGGYEEAVKRGLANQDSTIPLLMVKNWHLDPLLIKALSNRVQTGMDKLDSPEQAAVLFTAHSLPRRAVGPDDPYQAQLLESSRLVAEQSGVKSWDFAFQSAGEPRDAWLGPQILEQITSLGNRDFKEILVCPIGFVSDHLEILYDLDLEAKQHASSLGLKLQRTSSLNSDTDFISCLASVAHGALKQEAPVLP
jgi:protoporphyrin/coproporphyrin ferrochelatase